MTPVEPAAARRVHPAAWIGAAAVLGLVLGLAVGLAVPRLTRPGENSPEAGFARDMSTHHSQAVEMGLIAYANATDPEVRTLGQDIATNQQGQIGIMQTWLQDWGLDATGSQPAMAWMPDGAAAVKDGLMPGMATPQEMSQLRASTGKDVDRRFLRLMRQHHLGGIHMAEAIVKLSDDKHVTDLAKMMIAGQQGEIQVIQNLLARLGEGS